MLACLVVVLSPLLQLLSSAGGIPLGAMLAALAIGVVMTALYLRTLW